MSLRNWLTTLYLGWVVTQQSIIGNLASTQEVVVIIISISQRRKLNPYFNEFLKATEHLREGICPHESHSKLRTILKDTMGQRGEIRCHTEGLGGCRRVLWWNLRMKGIAKKGAMWERLRG